MEKQIINADERKAYLDRLMGIAEKEAKDVKPVTAGDEYKKTFWNYARGLTPKNALKEGLDGSGGVLVPDSFENALIEGLKSANVFRRLGQIIQLTHDRKFPIAMAHGSASWIDETGAVEESDETFGQIALSAYKATTLMKISDELLEDSGFDMEAFIAKQFAERIGLLEEEAFATGDGVKKPTGILHDALQGALTAETGLLGMDDIFELYHGVNTKYRENATWVMNDSSYKTLYKIRSGRGQNLWQPSLVSGEPEMLLGHKVEISDAMPNPESGNKPILFGDFRFYLIADRKRRGLKRLDELYAETGQVGFLTYERVDAKLTLPEAVKYLQIK